MQTVTSPAEAVNAGPAEAVSLAEGKSPSASSIPAPKPRTGAGGPKCRSFRVLYATDCDDLMTPRLYVVDRHAGSNAFDELVATAVSCEEVGVFFAAYGATALEIECAAMAAFGEYHGRSGPPLAVELVDAGVADRLVARIIVCAWTWPRYALPGETRSATPAAIASAIGRPLAVVQGVFDRFHLSNPLTD